MSICYFVPKKNIPNFEKNVKDHDQINGVSELALKVIPLEKTVQWNYTWGDRKDSDHKCIT